MFPKLIPRRRVTGVMGIELGSGVDVGGIDVSVGGRLGKAVAAEDEQAEIRESTMKGKRRKRFIMYEFTAKV